MRDNDKTKLEQMIVIQSKKVFLFKDIQNLQ